MKILLVGDYSGVHTNIAAELRARSHSVTLVSDGNGNLDTPTDIYLSRRPGMAGSFRYLADVMRLCGDLRGYDAVQLINPGFFSLRPGKLSYFFKELRRNNGAVFMTLAGNDYFFVKACAEARMFRFSEFRIGTSPHPQLALDQALEWRWLGNGLRDYTQMLYDSLTGAMSLLPEYDMAARPILGDRLAYTGLPVDLSRIPFRERDFEGRLKIMVGIRGGMEVQKGTLLLLEAARRLEAEMPERVEVMEIRDVPLREYLLRLGEADIVLDQLYSYSPGMNGLQTMASGAVAGTGGQPEYYSYLPSDYGHPVFTLAPGDNLKENLRTLVSSPSRLRDMAAAGRRLVEECNSAGDVTERFISHWQKMITV